MVCGGGVEVDEVLGLGLGLGEGTKLLWPPGDGGKASAMVGEVSCRRGV